MTIYVRRQNAARSAEGLVDSLAEGYVFPYRLTDVLPKYVLKLDSGKYTSDYIRLDATDSRVIPLPAAYSSAEKLHCVIRSTAICRVAIVDPLLGSSTFLIKATSGSTKGDHPGILQWQGRVTSITINVPTAFDSALIDYFLFEIPDLTDADSWRTGTQAIGYVGTTP